MKLLDKIKDLFMDEVTDDDEFELEEEEKEEHIITQKNELPKVMRETIKKEEKSELNFKTNDFIQDEKIERKSESSSKKFNFPIDMESDFPSRNSRSRINEEIIRKFTEPKEEKPVLKREIPIQNVHHIDNNTVRSGNVNVLNIEKEAPKKVADLYNKKLDDKNIKPKFKASPVISPVYGVLDKNYTKEEVKERTDDNTTMKRPSKKVDFETVRKKAFGNLADDIKDNLLCENCELYKEVKKISALSEDDLLYDMTVDDDEEKEVTLEKAYDDYEEFGVAYEPKVEKKKLELDDTAEIKVDNIINDNNKVDEEEKVESFSMIKSKIDTEMLNDGEEVKVLKDVDALRDKEEVNSKKEKEEVPSRSDKKKETKVDEDFFELIDSMYKERVDE